MTRIDTLINQFLQLGPHASVGIKKDIDPGLHEKIKECTKEFLTEHPYLEKDPGYIEFLQKYSGCFFFRKKDGFAIDVFGFGPRKTQFWMGNDRIGIDPGFLLFALVYRRASFNMQIDFGFDMTGNREWGVYAHYCYTDNTKFELEYASFEEWLKEVLESKEHII